MQETNKKRLEKLIARGALHFVVARGILLFGLTGALLISFWQTVRYGDPFFKTLADNLPTFAVAGFFFGLFLWYHVNKQYRRYYANK
ncbi:MAG: hypothetical protein KDJ38_20270 [Gammaproteobacteria bacterium]|nr:hypothetical protein [Gammaproteobacteria bacterium]